MAEYTQNYSLKKPLPNEFYDVADQNSNMDKIDSALKKHDDLLDKKVDLDETGKIPQEQLPELDFIPNSEKGQPNGVAELDKDKKLKAEQVPTNITSHIANKQNPHGVTAAQVGAYTKDETNNLINTTISASVIAGSYIGDGTATRFINLGFTPKAVLLLLCDGATMISASGYPTYFGGLALIDKPVKAHNGTAINNILDITTNGFNVHFKQSDSISSNDNRFLNNEYYYIAIR